MGWCDWFCCQKTQSVQYEEEVIIPTTVSPSSNEHSSYEDSPTEMGKAASKVKSLFGGSKSTLPQDTSTNDPDFSHIIQDCEAYEALASPRSPLIRNIETLTPPDSPILPPLKKKSTDIVLYLDFPILKDNRTINYVQNNKVMVIMKGLSGSGKSTVARHIQMEYDDAVICSADDFFMIDGEYKFDFTKLKDVHAACQKKARDSVERNTNVVIIDNTNIRNWEYQAYVKMAKDHNYVVLILEPQTPWRFDATQLAIKSSHGLEEELLSKKLKTYQQVSPIYYAWFLNQSDSQMICKVAWQLFERSLLELEEFNKDFSQNTNSTSLEEMLHHFTNRNITLHLTAKFTNRGKSPGAVEYIDSPEVKGALGKCYPISIIGYVITPRTFGARIKVTTEQLELWGNDDQETRPPNEVLFNANTLNGNNDDTEAEENKMDQAKEIAQASIIYQSQSSQEDRFHPTSGKGSRGHLTLGCADGVKAVTTGFDLIDVVSSEQRLKSTKEVSGNDNIDTSGCAQENRTYKISGAILKSYGEGTWVIYPEEALIANSLFSAYY